MIRSGFGRLVVASVEDELGGYRWEVNERGGTLGRRWPRNLEGGG